MSASSAMAFYAALNARDEGAVTALMRPDCPTGLPGVPPGPLGFLAVARRMAQAFPDLHHAVLECIGPDGKLAVVTRTTGTHAGALMGHAATGRRFSALGIDVLEFEAGRIVRRTGVFDTVTLLHQLGLYR